LEAQQVADDDDMQAAQEGFEGMEEIEHVMEQLATVAAGNGPLPVPVTGRRRLASRGRVYERANIVAGRLQGAAQWVALILQLSSLVDAVAARYLAHPSFHHVRPVDLLPHLVPLCALLACCTPVYKTAQWVTSGYLASSCLVGTPVPSDVQLASPALWIRRAGLLVTLVHFTSVYVASPLERITDKWRIIDAIRSAHTHIAAMTNSRQVKVAMKAVYKCAPDVAARWGGETGLPHFEVPAQTAVLTAAEFQSVISHVLTQVDEALASMVEPHSVDALRDLVSDPSTRLALVAAARDPAACGSKLHSHHPQWVQLYEANTARRAAYNGQHRWIPKSLQLLLQTATWLLMGPMSRPRDLLAFSEEHMHIRSFSDGRHVLCNATIFKEQAALETTVFVVHPEVVARFLVLRLFTDLPFNVDVGLVEAQSRLETVAGFLTEASNSVWGNGLVLTPHLMRKLTCLMVSQMGPVLAGSVDLDAVQYARTQLMGSQAFHGVSVSPMAAHSERLEQVTGMLAMQNGHLPSTAGETFYNGGGSAFSDMWGRDESSSLRPEAARLLHALTAYRMVWLHLFEPQAKDLDALGVHFAYDQAIEKRVRKEIRTQYRDLRALLATTTKGKSPGASVQDTDRINKLLVAHFQQALEWATHADWRTELHALISMPCGLRKSSLAIMCAWALAIRGDHTSLATILIMPTLELCKDVLNNTLLQRLARDGLRAALYGQGRHNAGTHLLIGCAESFATPHFFNQVATGTIRPVALFVDEIDTVQGQLSYRTSVVTVSHWLISTCNVRVAAMTGAYNEDRLRDLAMSRIIRVREPHIWATHGDLIDPSVRVLFQEAHSQLECWQHVAHAVNQLVTRPRADGKQTRVIVLAMTTDACAVIRATLEASDHTPARVAIASSGVPAPREFFQEADAGAHVVNVVVATTVLEVGISSTFVDAVVVAGASYSVQGLVQFMHRTARGDLAGRPEQVCWYVYCHDLFRSVVGTASGTGLAAEKWRANLHNATLGTVHSPAAVDRAHDLLSAKGLREFHRWALQGQCLTKYLRDIVNGPREPTVTCGTCSNCHPEWASILIGDGPQVPPGVPIAGAAPQPVIHAAPGPVIPAAPAPVIHAAPAPVEPFRGPPPGAQGLLPASTISLQLVKLARLLAVPYCIFCECKSVMNCDQRLRLLPRRKKFGWCFMRDIPTRHPGPCPKVVF
jgi:hypothetical protein